MHSLFYLIIVFILTACLLIAQGTEFLALVYLIVYIGAIAVFFLFVIMLINLRREDTTINVPFNFRLQLHFLLQLSLSFCVIICSQMWTNWETLLTPAVEFSQYFSFLGSDLSLLGYLMYVNCQSIILVLAALLFMGLVAATAVAQLHFDAAS